MFEAEATPDMPQVAWLSGVRSEHYRTMQNSKARATLSSWRVALSPAGSMDGRLGE